MHIGQAEPAHLRRITEMAASWQLSSADGEAGTRQGFLFGDWRFDDYARFFGEAEHFIVATEETELVGFLIAYSSARSELDPWLHERIRPHCPEYVFLEQICVAPGWTQRGVGTGLLSRMLLGTVRLPVISEISEEPFNGASSALHRKLGFAPVFRLTRPAGIRTAVWLRAPSEGESRS
ncbi:GNAT family N-acetyltransferase [Amycolatopsis sp. NPDC059090]|uniref:GNAT family N-acetyltransferase n=1 Tax=unclassified Amycolatopsis TaxID=2618356 RepID=UPI003672C9FF